MLKELARPLAPTIGELPPPSGSSDALEGRFRPVLNKQDFTLRYRAGEFGNAAPTWLTLEEYLESGYVGLVHLRNRVAGGQTWYNLMGPFALRWGWKMALGAGYTPDQLYISAMCPHDKNLLQGEVMETEHGLYLYYSAVVGKPMRDALAEGAESAFGLTAVMILRRCLCPNSLEWMAELLRRYPGHVVEFTALSVAWGTLSNFNTIFWEVRKY